MTRRACVAALIALVSASSMHGNSPGAEEWSEGVWLYHEEEYRQAQEAFQNAVRRDPGNSEYERWLGVTIGRRAERMTGIRRVGALSLARQVKGHFERAIQLDGTNLEALEALHGFHLMAPGVVGGIKDEARRLAGVMEELDEARGAAAWAAYHEDRREFELAQQQHLRARELAPEMIDYLLRYASFLSRRGRHAESDQLFEEALRRKPEHPAVWVAVGAAWIKAKRKPLFERARGLLERYLAAPDREPKWDPPFIVRRLLNRI